MKMAFRLFFSILKLVFFLLTLSIIGCTKGCVERERLALLDFKKSFSFTHSYSNLSSWNSNENSKNCCTWEGIICDNHTRHVVSLDLSFRSLESYQLRASLLELQHLRSLDLSSNNLNTIIPEFIGSFRKLISLDIARAGFVGMIPPQLGNLSNIQTLHLGSNMLSTDNFHWLSHLSSLQNFDMSSLNFSGAKDWLSGIKKMPILSNYSCESCFFPISDLSHTASHLVNSSSALLTLDLYMSHMSSSDLSLLLMNSTSNLYRLWLSDLKLEVPFPNIFHDMSSLEILDLSYNHFEVGVFNSIWNLCNLKRFYASGCIIKQSHSNNILQASLSGCASSSLEYMRLDSINLTGTIPSMLKLQSLTFLDLSDNHMDKFSPLKATLLNHQALNTSSKNIMNGSLSNTLPLFPATLTELHLDNNNLGGVLSDAHFTNLSQLQELSLANNLNLTVRFNQPLTGVSFVDLRSCNLGPSFPSWLLSPNSIAELYISHCMISGTIPDMFWMNLSPFLLYLDFSSNDLQGTVPNVPFRFFYADTTIDLSSNAFSGLIPFFFFMARGLYLSKNNFSGFAPIPNSYNFSASLPYVYYLEVPGTTPIIVDLSDNLLSGLIPHWLGFQTPKFGVLNLANNNLSGTIPSSVGRTLYLYILSLRNNSFSGPLPPFLKNCSDLRILDLGGNRFSGFIPSWMGKYLKNLIVLSLGFNNMTGKLPISLCHLNSLQILDISHNMLSGNIPSCIQDFSAMTHDVNSSQSVTYLRWDGLLLVPLEDVFYFYAYIKWKNKVWLFKNTLKFVKLIDLSSNNLSGEIPTGLTSLVELDSVDLSCNNLQGSIPEQIGQLKSLQFLNLSSNRLSGQIPSSLSEISSLEMLDLSHNNLSGRIPSGTQLGGFNATAYSANPYLCGMPLNKCPEDKDDSVQALQPSPSDGSEIEDKWADEERFFAGLGTGFTFGFLGILATLTWIRKWRYAFFKFATQFGEWIPLIVALNMPKISRKLRLK